jgi:hypothetical protein
MVPSTEAKYLSGRHRQALRTNLRRASEVGIRCIDVSSAGQRRVLSGPWLTSPFPYEDSPATLEENLTPPYPDALQWVATDAGNVPLAVGRISIDAEWALVEALFGRSHAAGWMMHTRLTAATIDAGARYMIVSSGPAPLLSPGLQHFQRLLGYRVVNLSLR